jgi:DNA gyrase subunit A
MSDNNRSISHTNVEAELKKSYLEYSMSVIIGRALPDVRDGLKPVHRRTLFAMHQLNNDFNKPYKKSARVVGDVVGKYHPHGETAVYDTIVRLAQSFSMRYQLVDGQGNFGSVDGDPAAAMRYTEIRLQKIAHCLLEELDKDTVDFHKNYDNTENIPDVLPAQYPNLLVNGSSGIAVGMATNIPPHNLSEIIDACVQLIDIPESTTVDLMQFVQGPDFPTAAMINGTEGLLQAYESGRGKVVMRARSHFEENDSRTSIIVTELPYQVNKARLLDKIVELVRDKKIDGIHTVRDESDKEGMRIVIELKRGENEEVLLNNLYKQTLLQCSFNINMVVLSNGVPKTLGLRAILNLFLAHRESVVTRRTIYLRDKAKARAHILEGLALALSHIEEMIELIKSSKDTSDAKDNLLRKKWPAHDIIKMIGDNKSLTKLDNVDASIGLISDKYRLSENQAQAILDLKLQKLTGLERDKILEDYASLIEKIIYYQSILNDKEKLFALIKKEMLTIKDTYGDSRRTEIIERIDVDNEDLIPRQDMVVTISREGYIKTQEVDSYQAQNRGGRGKSSTQIKEADHIKHLLTGSSHDYIGFFTSMGRVYWLKTYQLPLTSRQSKGRPINNFLDLKVDEKISAVVPVKSFDSDRHLVMVTKRGKIKKVSLQQFSKPRAAGVLAMTLQDRDELVSVCISNGDQDIMIFSDSGKVIRFHEKTVRSMGRTASGVRGISLKPEQSVVSLVVVEENKLILTATQKGYGKRTKLSNYRITSRGGVGVISIIVSKRNGDVIGAIQVDQDDEVMLISNRGTLVRTPASQISCIGRNTQGVRLIQLPQSEQLIDLKTV